MVEEHIYFYGPHTGKVPLGEVMDVVAQFVHRDPNKFYKVIIGSDTSATHLEPFSGSIITAIIVWRVGRGAFYFLTESPVQTFYTRRDRIIKETMSSLTLAQEIRSYLKDIFGEEFFWDGNEIHADIGNNGESRDFIKEVTGLIKGFDFIPVIKPYAWGASTVADRYTGLFSVHHKMPSALEVAIPPR